MSLVPDYGDSSNTSESDSDKEETSQKTEEEERVQLPKPKLPPPDFIGNTDTSDAPKTSVFRNPFIEAENEKEAILEKHVKMVDSKDKVVLINGKRICWNYRKGRCRFGHNCKYAHDSDIQKTKEQLDSEKQAQQTIVCQTSQLSQPTPTELEQIDEEPQQNKKKRKRPGLTQGLIPGKKVMKQYMSLKS